MDWDLLALFRFFYRHMYSFAETAIHYRFLGFQYNPIL